MRKITWRRVETPSFVAGVKTNEQDIVIETAPILKQFMGQPFKNIRNWLLKNQTSFKIDLMEEPHDKA